MKKIIAKLVMIFYKIKYSLSFKNTLKNKIYKDQKLFFYLPGIIWVDGIYKQGIVIVWLCFELSIKWDK